MKKLIIIAVLLFCAISLAVAQSTDSVNWQYSEAASIRLGVRDKWGTLGRYEATFIVTGADRKKYEKTLTVTDDNWGFVNFPDDFTRAPRSGRFSWVCIVRGKTALSGQFQLATSDDLPRSKSRRAH